MKQIPFFFICLNRGTRKFVKFVFMRVNKLLKLVGGTVSFVPIDNFVYCIFLPFYWNVQLLRLDVFGIYLPQLGIILCFY